ncbi:MAG: DUF349 domain-containing protein [Actinomycetales bacterium]
MAVEDYGRVADDGTVYVRTAGGEREVGSYPGASADEALAYFARKYDDIDAQISLFAQRLNGTDMSPRDIDAGIKRLRELTTEPNAVGDLTALCARVDAVEARAREKRSEAAQARAKTRAEQLAARAALVEEAERIAATPPERTQWRTDGQRMKDLFDEWKAHQKSGPRLDRGPEEELWHRFSHARTTFDRHRRQHFAQLETSQAEVKLAKQALVKEAEALSSSRDWGPTSAAYKRLMDRWRAAGRASRKDDDALWARFRGAQDAFFAARNEVQSAEEEAFRANLAVKEQLLTEAEALLPVSDLAAAKETLRGIQERWEAAGKVPRSDMDRIEKRIRKVEQVVRDAEEERWKRSNPEARARAESAVSQLEEALASLREQLAKAQARGDAKAAADAESSIEARSAWLEQARATLEEFSG